LVGVIAVLGWLAYLSRHAQAKRRLWHSRVLKVAWAFPAVCILGVVVSFVVNDSSDPRGFSSAVSIALLAVMAVMIENLVDSTARLNQLLLVVVLSSVVAAMFPLAYNYGVDLYTPLGVDAALTVEGGRAAGLTNNANALGLATSMGLFALLIYITMRRRLWEIVLFAGVALIMLGGLMLSGSRTHLVAAVACIAFFGALRMMGPKRGRVTTALVGLAILPLMFYAYTLAPERLQERFIVVGGRVEESTLQRAEFAKVQHRHALDIVMQHPLLGVGLTNFHFPPTSQVPEGYDPHDTFSMVLGETGIAGALAASWLVLSCWMWLYEGWRVARRRGHDGLFNLSAGLMATLAAMLVASLGGYILFYQRWFWITAGLSAVIARWATDMGRPSGAVNSQPRLRLPRSDGRRGADRPGRRGLGIGFPAQSRWVMCRQT
jgi:hypothetical protein